MMPGVNLIHPRVLADQRWRAEYAMLKKLRFRFHQLRVPVYFINQAGGIIEESYDDPWLHRINEHLNRKS